MHNYIFYIPVDNKKITEKLMDLKKFLGKRIRETRKARKLTQERVAELIGIETPSLSNIENGKYYPTAENLEKILKVLNISAEELFHIEEKKSAEETLKEIIQIIKDNPSKINDIYKIVKAITT